MKAQAFLDVGWVAVEILATRPDDLHLIVLGERLREVREEIWLVLRDENDPLGRVARSRQPRSER